jgi:hypothetical protein
MKIPSKNFDSPSATSAHFWPGYLDVAFVFSAPGRAEADQQKPIFDLTGRHLDLALKRHLAPALPTIFPSRDRYDYRITNAHALPLAHALGDARTEADDAEIRIERVRDELIGCRLVVLCGDKAKLLKKHLSDFAVVSAGHLSMTGLNRRWPDRKQLAANPNWTMLSTDQRTAERISCWARDVAGQVSIVLGVAASDD